MHMVQARGRREGRRDCGLEAQTLSTPVGERTAGQQLHDEEPQLAVLAIVVHRHDVRMVEVREEAGLAPEPGDVFGGLSRGAGELLDRDFAPEPKMSTPPHDAERAAADLARHLVVGKRVRNVCHVRRHDRGER